MAGLTGRAAAFYGPDIPMEIKEYPVPDPEPGAIVVRTTLANICESDLHQWRGEFDVAKFGRPYPQILGHEMTGRVYALGEGVTRDTAGTPLQPGDRVIWRYFYPCGSCRACMKRVSRACPNARSYLVNSCDVAPHFYGAFGDYYYVRPGAAIFRVPDELPDETVAGINCALSQVVGGMQLAGLTLGETVVIQGAGGLGVYAAAVAAEKGASKVISIDGQPHRLEMARRCGATDVIDINELKTPAERVQRVKDLTDGRGADIVVEVVGIAAATVEGLDMVRFNGKFVDIGNIVPQTVTFPATKVITSQIQWRGLMHYNPWIMPAALDFLVRTKDRYPLSKVVSHSFPLAEVNKAFEFAEWQGKGGGTAATRVILKP
jgi:threonine dehydrogenase-like Zn-dependent dehydrogenase